MHRHAYPYAMGLFGRPAVQNRLSPRMAWQKITPFVFCTSTFLGGRMQILHGAKICPRAGCVQLFSDRKKRQSFLNALFTEKLLLC
jgi:hypothetical protein